MVEPAAASRYIDMDAETCPAEGNKLREVSLTHVIDFEFPLDPYLINFLAGYTYFIVIFRFAVSLADTDTFPS